MRKAFVTACIVTLAATLVSCGKKTYEIALVTDVGTINDKSFNQGAWEGVEAYAKEKILSSIFITSSYLLSELSIFNSANTSSTKF